jgi:Taurine catabolism dioxygenase TauD, TfdA family
VSQPRAIESGVVWTAADVGDARGWTDELDGDAVAALHAAIRHARRRGADATTVTREDFPLGALEDRIAAWQRDLARGRGFVLVRGFPVADLGLSDVELAYTGLGMHHGTPVSQDAVGTTLGHVVDERVGRTGPEVRLNRTNQRQDFHTDGADVIGLLCLHGARRGAQSRIVSAAAVYNELLRRDPGLVDTLYDAMPWDRNGEGSPGKPPFYLLPVLNDVDGRPRFFYIGW